ncbi:MAG: DUF58 domain-containing protein [Acidimicrobiales bacterium]
MALSRQFMVLAAMAAAFQLVSSTTGSDWLVVVVAGLVATLALSAVLPVLTLTGARLSVRAPTDAVAGRPMTVAVTAAGRVAGTKLRVVRPLGDWVRVDGSGTGDVVVTPDRRGVLTAVDVEVRSAAPFGLVWWRRRSRLPLARPLEVAPAPLAVEVPSERTGEGVATGASPAHPIPGDELVRSVREYVPGDPPRSVAWAATARHGRLLVKEREGDAGSALTIVVDLRSDGSAAGRAAVEDAASRAAGLAVAALRSGTAVVLGTSEAGGLPRLGPAETGLEVGRRLARAAGDGPPAEPPGTAGGYGHGVVRVSAR